MLWNFSKVNGISRILKVRGVYYLATSLALAVIEPAVSPQGVHGALGVKCCHYLQFKGSRQAMVTPPP